MSGKPMSFSHLGVKFAISPSETGWAWSVVDMTGAPLASGQAKSRREAAAFVIRDIIRSTVPTAPMEERRAA